MLYYKFKNYEEFKEIFGIQQSENGKAHRKNKILLALLKSKDLLHHAVLVDDLSIIDIINLVELKLVIDQKIRNQGGVTSSLPFTIRLNNKCYHSALYASDEFNGLCEDGDTKSIRYINKDNGRVFKMKAGKFYRSIILETELGKYLPEQVLVYLCEEFTADWQTYTMGQLPQNTLCVDDEFEKIYSSYYTIGNFGSCMMNRDLHYFYKNAVDASAAYLKDSNDMIIARCIIYNKVYDETNRIWRLAERQYSSDGNEVLKRILIDSLIKDGHIDGYKTVGAGCGDARSFVDIHGNSLCSKKFRIDCHLEDDSDVSYQDSFKWYDRENYIADNYNAGNTSLDITEGSIMAYEGEYDNWHDCYVSETTSVYHYGNEYRCDINDLDDFVWINSIQEYHHEDDVIKCEICDNYILMKDAYYSELTKEYYDSESCMEDDENDYKERNWYYSDYDQEYYEDDQDVIDYQAWNEATQTYQTKTMHTETANYQVINHVMWLIDGVFYDTIDEETHFPYGYEKILETA